MHSLIPLFSCSTNLYCPPVVGTPWVTFKEVRKSLFYDTLTVTWGVEDQCKPLSLGGDSCAPAWSGWASPGPACRGDPPWAAWAPSSAAPPPCPRASAGQSPWAGPPGSHWSAPCLRIRIKMMTTFSNLIITWRHCWHRSSLFSWRFQPSWSCCLHPSPVAGKKT